MPIPPQIRDEIQRRLDAVALDHGVRILYANESGSRAWGFPSQDSDYDVRFIYAHPLPWYVSVAQRRDVIELPIQDAIDLKGWDIRKALGLFRKSNRRCSSGSTRPSSTAMTGSSPRASGTRRPSDTPINTPPIAPYAMQTCSTATSRHPTTF